MAQIVSYYMTDSESSAYSYITDYSAAGLAAIASAEQNGAILRAVYDDGTEAQVTASQVTNPNVGGTGSAAVGASYNYTGSSSGGGLSAQSDSFWSGTVTVGSTVLEFEDGLLVAVS